MRFTTPLAALLLLIAPVAHGAVELHAHLFMKEGLSWFFSGDFNGPLQATSWKDRFSSQANPETLEKSGLKIVVASLYAHPLLTLSLRDSIRRQLDQAEAFVAAHPNWIIARSGIDAEVALAQGKRVIVLALEGAAGVIEDEADMAEFIDRRGIRIVTFLHLTDDFLGGVAFLRGAGSLASPVAWARNLFSGHRGEGDVKANDRGLSESGRKLLDAFVARGVWIDLAHSSDLSQKDLVPVLEKAGQPLLYTHTVLRSQHPAERAISDQQLADIKRLGGIVGLMPSEDMLKGTSVPADLCPAMQCPSGCEGGAHALAAQYRELAGKIGGAEGIALGTDYNGGIPHLRPSCGTGTVLDQEGMWNISQAGDVWKSLAKLGAPVPSEEARVRKFLSAWKAVRPKK
jgi:microsomal dipeptidase-like Zn-dependent dipeptidase